MRHHLSLFGALAIAVAAACSANGGNESPKGPGVDGGGAAGVGGESGVGGLGGSAGAGGTPFKGDPTVVIGPGADASSPTKFGGTPDATAKPSLVYPEDGILVPLNMNSLEIHFNPSPGQTLFEISFESSTEKLVVYTTCTALNGGCVYTPDPSFWSDLATKEKGAPPVHYRVRG